MENKKTKYPTCSHCGYELSEDELWYETAEIGKVHTGDCDTSDLKCPNSDCGKTFYVACTHEIMFMAVDVEGEKI